MASDQESAKSLIDQPTFTPRDSAPEILGSLVTQARGMLRTVEHNYSFMKEIHDLTEDYYRKGRVSAYLENLEFEMVQLREAIKRYDDWQRPPF
jgi:hypothetical protein